MRSTSRILVVALTLFGCIGCDQASKSVARAYLGDLIDRLADHGFVTDFMNVGFGALRTGIFNVADLAIVAGVLVLLLARSGSDADAA